MSAERSQERKDYIGTIAGGIFYEKGFKASSLKDIALKGGISKAGIYHYYKTKEEILLYILLKNTEDGVKALRQVLRQSKALRLGPRKSFEGLIRAYAAHLLKSRKISLLVLRERHQLAGEYRNILREQEKSVFRLIRDQLANIPNTNKHLNLNLVSFQIMSMIHWMGYWFDARGLLSQAAAIDQTIMVIFNGMLEKNI